MRSVVSMGLALVLAGTAPLGGRIGTARPEADAVVALDGHSDFTTVQGAIDAVPSGNTAPFVIAIRPGTYPGPVSVPADKPFISLRGLGHQPSDVVITDDRANGTLKPDGTPWGTSG